MPNSFDPARSHATLLHSFNSCGTGRRYRNATGLRRFGGGALIGKRRKMKIVNNKTAPVPTIQTSRDTGALEPCRQGKSYRTRPTRAHLRGAYSRFFRHARDGHIVQQVAGQEERELAARPRMRYRFTFAVMERRGSSCAVSSVHAMARKQRARLRVSVLTWPLPSFIRA